MACEGCIYYRGDPKNCPNSCCFYHISVEQEMKELERGK